MILEAILTMLTFIAVTLVAGNNLSACVGPAIGARILNKSNGALLGATGFASGLLIQGAGMTRSVGVLLPNATSYLQIEALIVAVAVFVVAALVRVPMSLGMSLVGLLAGLSVARGNSTEATYVACVASTWIVAPIAAVLLAFSLIRALNRSEPKNTWRRIRLYKVFLIALSFTTAYVLGANTVGLIVATAGFNLVNVATASAATFVGAFLLSEGAIRRVSQEFYLMRYSNATVTLLVSTILVEAATTFNIPLSNTQATAAAVFGTGLSYRTKFMSLKPFLTIMAGWVIAPLFCFAVGLIIA